MGLLIKGQWHDQWYDTKSTKGEFMRSESIFRHWITTDGSAGPTGKGGFKAEKNRYHLYVSLACPWAHRTLIFRKLKALEDYITISVVHPHMLENGWSFAANFTGATGDNLYQKEFLHEIYTLAEPYYTGRVTVPVLWDKHNKTIVSNESADIIRMMNSAFNHLTGNREDFYPVNLQSQIDAFNKDLYTYINNGVYKCGFATTQEAYDAAISLLFNRLDKLEDRLRHNGPYLHGEVLTESDWRLFTTLIRFDLVYVQHFKCNIKRIQDYPALSQYLNRLYTYPGIQDTINIDHIKSHYFYSHRHINPTGIIPKGPETFI